VLAGPQSLGRDRGVHRRDRQVDDDLDLGVDEKLVGGAGLGHIVLVGLCLGASDIEVADHYNAHVGKLDERCEVLVADCSGADHSHSNSAGGMIGHRRPFAVR
jgi:hypothetical protein